MLNELDKYMKALIDKYDKENEGKKPYITNPEYHRYDMRISRLKRKILKLEPRTRSWILARNDYIRAIKARRRLKSVIPNPNFVKVRYVRYADDWIVGIWGTKEFATKLKMDLTILLGALKLELSPDKTLITNARSGRAKFLGTFIKRSASDK